MRLIFLVFIFLTCSFAENIKPITGLYYDESKAKLGKRLFYDTRLSPSGRLSCEYCHNLYWQGNGTSKYNISASSNNQLNPPTILNAALHFIFFFDGRIRDINKQVEISIKDPYQLGSSEDIVLKRLKSDPEYVREFKNIYGRSIEFEDVVDALVNFEKALITPNSKFDLYLQGDENAITSRQKQGYEIFKTHGCIECHNGVNMGANTIFGGAFLGNENIKMKIPSLRNIAITQPYMHDGSISNLKDLIKQMNFMYELSDEDVELIYEFFDSLTGERPEILNEK